jgi:hypothetical protein
MEIRSGFEVLERSRKLETSLEFVMKSEIWLEVENDEAQ